MKKGLHRIVIPTLSICLGAAIVGSISGTVAWYQYSTRVSAAYLGTSAGTSGNLKLRIKGSNTATDDKWSTSLTHTDIGNYIDAYLEEKNLKQDIMPITSGNMTEDAAIKTYNAAADPDNDPVDMKPLFYKNPVRSYTESVPYDGDAWIKADESMYVQIPLELCYVEYDGKPTSSTNSEDKEYLAKDVYISDLLIQEDYQNKANGNDFVDLSSAVRVHISSSYKEKVEDQLVAKTNNKLISKNGGTILTEGYLDLDGDGKTDTVTVGTDSGAAYGFGGDTVDKNVTYGYGTQKAYKAAVGDTIDGSYKNLTGETVNEKVYPAVAKSLTNSVVLDENDLTFNKGDVATSKSIGKTIGYKADDANYEQEYLEVVLTIWLEGWQTLPAPTPDDENAVSSIWSKGDFIGSMFDVGIQFAVQAE